ncbi:hypothetical protein EKN06_11310 [Croceicoccus ponticola]|uniref:Uncharacterized protein n=1 Tax=Croceicoccus ponticola TaxID=2217664 RepID=A0A437GWX0_9SPHN|nr:enoyl-CoA hydratase-related protein [Croceicoccus ponticola]RVQ66594.1 hypothetical protein EKN06_11310 [Croceicoccus ponticola]
MRGSQALLLTIRRVPAAEALEIGLVMRVADEEALADEAMLAARKLAAGQGNAFGRTKELLLSTLGKSLRRKARSQFQGSLRS